jgi:hypothetical protein
MKSEVFGHLQRVMISFEVLIKTFVKYCASKFRKFQIPSTVLCEIITVQLGYHKFCAVWV